MRAFGRKWQQRGMIVMPMLGINGSGSGYAATGYDLDGTNDYLTRGANLTGIGDTDAGLFSCWIRPDSTGTMFTDTSQNIFVSMASGTVARVTIKDSANVQQYQLDATIGSGWNHMAFSWDFDIGAAYYLNGVLAASSATTSAGSCDYSADTDWIIGAASAAGSTKFNGQMAEVFFTNTYLDLSTGINSFIIGGRPVDLGADGSTPTGTQPFIYIRDLSAGTNLGSGGNFTVTGSIPAASVPRVGQ